ncbi:hypothetical protein [Fischerella sp. PCC 9605]|nr:hypothetical protein [Fischerella sp. PCC 9605]
MLEKLSSYQIVFACHSVDTSAASRRVRNEVERRRAAAQGRVESQA